MSVDPEASPVAFLTDLMRRRKKLPSQLARELGISHATVARWLAGEDRPSLDSAKKLAQYAGISLQEVLGLIGHSPVTMSHDPLSWPEFREYALKKYPAVLDEDLVTMIEDLIERRRKKRIEERKKSS